MNKYYVTPEISLVLRELGFDVPCTKGFTPDGFVTESIWPTNFNIVPSAINPIKGYTSQPLWIQAINWFKERFNILGFIVPSHNELHPYSFVINRVNYTDVCFDTPEIAYQACVLEIIDYIKSNDGESTNITGPEEQEGGVNQVSE